MQLNHVPYLLTALLLIASEQAFGQKDDQNSADWKRCLDKSGGVTASMLDCNSAEWDREDKRLNKVYGNVMSKLSPDRKKQLQTVQRLWIQYTRANCDFWDDPDSGTAANLAASSCRLKAQTDGQGA